MIGYDVQLRHQLCTTGAGLEGSRSRRKVVVLNVNDVQSLLNCPINRLVDFCNDFLVVFRDIILQVDHDQCAVFHIVSLSIHGMAAPETDAGCSPEPSVSHCSLLASSQHIAALPLEGSPHPLRRRKSEARCSFAKWHEPYLLNDPAIPESKGFAGSTDRSVHGKM